MVLGLWCEAWMSINLKLRGRLFAMVSLALAGMLIIGIIALASLRAELLHDRELKTKDPCHLSVCSSTPKLRQR
jgi:hypothetical protein